MDRETGAIDADVNIDASLYGVFQFGMLPADDPKVVATMEQIEERLWCKTDIGGVARYENDYYHQISQDVGDVPGNPWIICTLWLAEWYIAKAKTLLRPDPSPGHSRMGPQAHVRVGRVWPSRSIPTTATRSPSRPSPGPTPPS